MFKTWKDEEEKEEEEEKENKIEVLSFSSA